MLQIRCGSVVFLAAGRPAALFGFVLAGRPLSLVCIPARSLCLLRQGGAGGRATEEGFVDERLDGCER